jgi:hypothetical protein
MGLFQEYMDAKGKVVKPKVDISGGDPSPKTPPTKPPKEHGDKPYAASNGKGPKNKSEKGLGDQGDASLKYEPSDDPSSKGHPPAKIPTVEQFELTSLVAEAAIKDQTLIENLVRQLKANGLLGPLVAEMLQHKDTYRHISEIMAHEEYGDDTCKSFVRAMSNEEVAPPFSDQLQIADDDEEINGDTMDDQGVMDMEAPPVDDNFEDLEVGFEDEFEQEPVDDPLMQMDPQMQQQMNPAMKNFQKALMGKFMDADNDVHQRMSYARHCKKMKKMAAQ